MGLSISIPALANGPPRSANGGYVAGLLANLIGGDAEVVLRAPPPLGVTLPVERQDDGTLIVWAAPDRVMVEARPATLDLALLPPVAPEVAEAAGRVAFGAEDDLFSTCIVCGRTRPEGQGLRVVPGLVAEGPRRFATLWRPHRNFCDGEGRVLNEVLWAALDCPAGFALGQSASGMRLLGRYVAHVAMRPPADAPLVVQAWPLREEGRKGWAGSAIWDAEGRLVGAAWSLWITVPAQF